MPQNAVKEPQNTVKQQNRILRIISKVIWGIVLGIFCILVLLVGWLLIDKFILQSPVPSLFGYSALSIESGSMSGTLEIGDMVIIKDTGDYKIGDIITFLHEGENTPTTHRIINYDADGAFITKGDANNVKDPSTVSADIILGEVVNVLPKVGFFSKWVRSEGWLYIVSALLILGLGMFILKSDKSRGETESSAEQKETENLSLIAPSCAPDRSEDTQQTQSADNFEESKDE